MHPMLNIAVRAAHAAGDHIIKHIDRLDGISIDNKGRNDFVTEVDKQAEEIIIGTLLNSYPNHSILAEESGEQGESEYQWVVDPLDGTTNFLHGFPQFAVSIALKKKGILDQAVIYDPLKQELFTASKGDGAYMNRKRIRVSKQKAMDGALIGTGFPFREGDDVSKYMKSLESIISKCSGIRRAGAASLDLAYVASGRLDGFWESGLKEWDIAAGALLIQEAGGTNKDLEGNNDFLKNGNIVSGNLNMVEALLAILKL